MKRCGSRRCEAVSSTHGLMSELRSVLLALGLLFIAALAWWEQRRARTERRGTTPERPTAGGATLVLPQMHAGEPLASPEPAAAEPQPTPPTVPVLEAASPGATFDAIPADSAAEAPPIEPSADPPSGALESVEGASAAAPLPPATGGTRAALPSLPQPTPPTVDWPPDAERRVLTLRLVAPLPERFAGRLVRQALSAEGFVLGRFAIFHKGDDEQRAVLSAASLNQPGTFDMETMDSQHYGGLSLFAVLPGPKAPSQVFDELVFTARSLNDRLCGVLQDEQGTPLTPARIAALRERLGATPS